MGRIRVGPAWYAALLIPPALILSVLLCLETFVSPVYAANRFLWDFALKTWRDSSKKSAGLVMRSPKWLKSQRRCKRLLLEAARRAIPGAQLQYANGGTQMQRRWAQGRVMPVTRTNPIRGNLF